MLFKVTIIPANLKVLINIREHFYNSIYMYTWTSPTNPSSPLPQRIRSDGTTKDNHLYLHLVPIIPPLSSLLSSLIGTQWWVCLPNLPSQPSTINFLWRYIHLLTPTFWWLVHHQIRVVSRYVSSLTVTSPYNPCPKIRCRVFKFFWV